MLDALLVMATLQMQMEVFALDAGRQEISKQGVCAWLVLVLQASFQGESLKDRLSPAVFLKILHQSIRDVSWNIHTTSRRSIWSKQSTFLVTHPL